jgi:hypothetical protein
MEWRKMIIKMCETKYKVSQLADNYNFYSIFLLGLLPTFTSTLNFPTFM